MISFKELDEIPLYEFQFLYYQYYNEVREEQRMTNEQKGAKALTDMIQDNL